MGQDFWPVELPLPFAVLFRLLKSYGPETIFISRPTVEDLRTSRCVHARDNVAIIGSKPRAFDSAGRRRTTATLAGPISMR
jgi:hypothetical protein